MLGSGVSKVKIVMRPPQREADMMRSTRRLQVVHRSIRSVQRAAYLELIKIRVKSTVK